MVLSALSSAVTTAQANNNEPVDTLKNYQLQGVQVVSTRADNKTPMAFSTLSQQDIKKVNFGLDLPYVLALTPSITTTSDAGNGIGYTSLRVRGTDPSRINITANGIPVSDAESSTTFWVKDVREDRWTGGREGPRLLPRPVVVVHAVALPLPRPARPARRGGRDPCRAESRQQGLRLPPDRASCHRVTARPAFRGGGSLRRSPACDRIAGFLLTPTYFPNENRFSDEA